MPGCWAGVEGSGRCALSGSRAPADTAPGWPATRPPPASASSRSTAPTGRTAAARASPTRWTRSAPPGPRSPAGPRRAGRTRRRGRSDPRADGRQAQRPLRADPRRTTRPARFTAHATADLVAELASLRPRPGAVIGYHTRIALRELRRRADLDITLSDGEGRGRTLTEPPFWVAVRWHRHGSLSRPDGLFCAWWLEAGGSRICRGCPEDLAAAVRW
jgi:hypothetical protein